MKTTLAASGGATSVPADFHTGLRQTVFAFMRSHNLSPIDQSGLLKKAVINYSLWFVMYAAYLFVGANYGWAALAIAPLLGFAMLCIVLSVMHDGSHGAFSNSKWLNTLAEYSLAFAGGCPLLWHYVHVRSHHEHTNVIGYDQDFESGGLIRLHSAQPRHKAHRFQQFYAWFLYSGHAIRWIWFDDIKDYFVNRWSITPSQKKKLLLEIIFAKTWHILSYLIIPWLVIGNWPIVVTFYLLHWMLLSSALVPIFAMAHLTHVQKMPASIEEGNSDWSLHQLNTTVDFATSNRILSWIVGGLNFQIEHHIFPKISHTRYRLIQPVIRDYCKAHGVRYFEYPTIRSVVAGHFMHLKTLGS